MNQLYGNPEKVILLAYWNATAQAIMGKFQNKYALQSVTKYVMSLKIHQNMVFFGLYRVGLRI